MNQNTVQKISAQIATLTEQDIDNWVVSEVTEHYSLKIKSLARYAYAETLHKDGTGISLSTAAFKEQARACIRSALFSFIFSQKHYLNGRDINSYILSSLNRLANRIKVDIVAPSKKRTLICPACEIYNSIEHCSLEYNMLRCYNCINSIERLSLELTSDPENGKVANELNTRRIFVEHSKKGFRCPECSKFLPKSCIKNQNFISCPYNDCSWFGSMNQLEKMNHPFVWASPTKISISDNHNILKDSSLNEPSVAEASIEVSEAYINDLALLESVIDEQITSLKRTRYDKSIILQLNMYNAFLNMIKNNSEEMVSYLVHQNYAGTNAPIQSRIFQEYVKITENSLPLVIKRRSKLAEITSLLDSDLNLFLGISTFHSKIERDLYIPNNTIETYTAERTLTCYGPCFIGYIIDITDIDNNRSLLNNIDYYSFTQIKMKDIEPDTNVKVEHFRIPSHYEVGALVNLQRIRRKIVDSVYLRKNGEKRK